jgi:hypothetical protein
MVVKEFFGSATSDATSVYGSADYFEHRLNNVRLVRRGSGLASNHIAAEGSDANENQRWVASAGARTADRHDTSLGSHLCDTEASGAFMDFDDAYISYTMARLMLCDASTIATTPMNCEMQVPTSWSRTSITAPLNRGAFASNALVRAYVCNADDVCNPTGFAVTLDSGSSPEIPRSQQFVRRDDLTYVVAVLVGLWAFRRWRR